MTALVFVLLVVGTTAAQAEKRVALVIGNGAYEHTLALPNPGRDASDVAAALTRLGFEVMEGHDLNEDASSSVEEHRSCSMSAIGY